MRLLKFDSDGELSLTDYLVEDIPRYAILSHTWRLDGDEVTFEDLQSLSAKSRAGYDKIRFCGERAKNDGLQYFWVDTCCIRKSSSAELQEAITAMFEWYRKAVKCYVCLSDVSINEHGNNGMMQSAFRNSRWFKRGWTLQELLAPRVVEFYSQEGELLGDKTALEQQIYEVTNVPVEALRGAPLANFTRDERLRWAENRETKRKEDKAYCLLGILDVSMYLNYGEGDKAFKRLNEEIRKSPTRNTSEPVWHVPFNKMSGFVGRSNELDDIKTRLFDHDDCPIMSLLGLGGVGKTRLALELAHQVKSERPQYSVFWVQAEKLLTFEEDILQIGKKLGIPGIDDAKADVKTLVKQQLQNWHEEKWFLILDNADDEMLWGRRSDSSQQELSLVDYLPRTPNGSVLVTTRSRQVATFLAENEVIHMDTLSPAEAAEMFINRTGSRGPPADQKAFNTLLDKLTNLPLAIVQATSFIKRTQCSVHTYLELLDQPEEAVIELLSKDFGDQTRYSYALNPIASTWLISFRHIREHHPLAAAFLSSMACLHEKAIPLSLLPKADSKIDTIEAIGVLTGYSFAEKRTGSESNSDVEELYDVHRLVQLAARNWLKMEDQLVDEIKACTIRLAELFPTQNHEFKSIWSIYLPHGQHLCENEGDFPERYRLLEKMGKCLLADGKYDNAVKAHSMVVNWREEKLGISNEQTLKAYNNLGEALNWKGDWSRAEQYLQQAFDGQKELFGQENLETLISMSNLASTYSNQGRWTQAEELGVQVMEIRKRVLGTEHPDTLTSMSNLALIYSNQGRWTQAEELGVQVMEISKRVLGTEHPDTLTSMSNLALTYWNQGQWTQAEELGVQVMEISKRVLGTEHPDTLTSMSNLALIYSNQGRWTQAEELGVQVMEIRKRALGTEHPDTLTSMSNLASTYWNQGRWTQAEELKVQVMEISKRVLGTEHPDTLTIMSNLASIYSNQGRWTQAEELGVQVMEIRKRVLGTEHPDTLTIMSNLASIYSNQGRWTQAEELGVQVMEIRKRVLGTEHPDTLTSMSNLASTYWNQGRWTQAEELQVQVMEIRKRVLGTEHPSTLTSINNLALTYSNQGRWTQAEELQVQVMEIRKRVLGTEHPDTLTSMSNLALTYSDQGRWTQAEELEVQVMEIRKRVLGTEHPSTLTIMSNLASTYSDQGQWTQAEELEVQVMEIRKRVLGTEHPSTLTSMNNLAHTYMEQQRKDDALTLICSCANLCLKVLGSSHPNTEAVLDTLLEWTSNEQIAGNQREQDTRQMPGAWVD